MTLGQISSNESMTPRTSAGTDSSAAATAFNTNGGNSQAVNYTPSSSRPGSVSQTQLTDAEVYTSVSPRQVSSR